MKFTIISNYTYIFLFLISIISLILYYVLILNILIYFGVIDITFDNITEINIFDSVNPKYIEIPESINVTQNIDKSIFSVFIDLFKSTNTSIKYFPSYFVGSNCIKYENYDYTILELVYSQHFITLNNQELIYINKINSIINNLLNDLQSIRSILTE